ncbi:MAG TPA: NAD(P)/FAD-dependent oxidoreductase [Acidimicrobiia bacterium]
MTDSYDAIIVGARCAGSPTAMLLARKGFRVLVIDRASFPSDTVSTHFIHAPGVAALHRWGLLDQVIESNCPPVDTYSVDFGPITISGNPRPSEGIAIAYAPRRTVLDKILVDAASRAGAEVREHFSLEEVVIEDGTVVGIRGHGDDGKSVTELARVVIGADGRNSQVAKAVRAEQYNEKPMLMWAYYTYWSGLPIDSFSTTVRPDRGWAAFPTNDELTLLVVGWPNAESTAYKSDVEANYLKTLELAPAFAEQVRGAKREERFAGGAVPNYFRKPYGPGWALVGDAGYNKDPITAQGISDAFHDAELCTDALDAAFTGERAYPDAMADYHQTRDTNALPIYEFTTQLATMEPPPPEMQQLLGAMCGNQDAMNMFVSITAGTVSPIDFFAPENIGRLMSTAHSA